MVSAISNVVAAIGGVGLIVGLLWAALKGNGDREDEEAARTFLSEHGHWPDEPPPAPR